MSGIYLIVLLFVWGFLTWLLWKVGRRFLDASFANRPVRLALVVIAGAFWFGGSFWEAGGKKLYWDAKVRELCAKDGGVKVYETVALPPEMFDKWGVVNIPFKERAKPDEEYYYESETYYLRKGNPEMWQTQYRIVRRSDAKILGQAVCYARRGGDFPGPWHPSSYGCPENGDISFLKKQVFPCANQ